MSVTIRNLTHDDIDDAFALSQFAFQYEMSKEQLEERKKKEKPEQTWGYFINEQLAAKMKIIPLEVFIQGKLFAMGGISSVATWPEYRRQGMVKQLLTHGLKEMKEHGQTVSFLHPFSFAYYRKYGWEYTFDEKKYTVKLDQFPRFNDAAGTVERKQNSDFPMLNPLYEEYAVKYNGNLKRSNEWWERHSVLRNKKMTIAVYFNRGGVPRGYIVYKVKDKEMEIDEFVHLDEECRRGLWQFIANHDSMLEKVTLIAPPDDALPFLLPDPRIKQEILPYFMGRIVDVKAFLEQYSFKSRKETTNSVLYVKDQYAPWNDGTYEVCFGERGGAEVVKFDSSEGDHDARTEAGLACDIQTLSAMLLGYQRPSSLYDIGRLKGDRQEVQQWENVIPRKTPCFLDFF